MEESATIKYLETHSGQYVLLSDHNKIIQYLNVINAKQQDRIEELTVVFIQTAEMLEGACPSAPLHELIKKTLNK